MSFENNGCNGGLPSHAYEYIFYNGGIESEDDYPYLGITDTCHFDKSKVSVTVKGVHNITEGAEHEIEIAVGTVGPVSIAYDCADDFMHYSEGIYSSDTCAKTSDQVNHAVRPVVKRCRLEGLNVGVGRGRRIWCIRRRRALLDRQEQLEHRMGRGRVLPHSPRSQRMRLGSGTPSTQPCLPPNVSKRTTCVVPHSVHRTRWFKRDVTAVCSTRLRNTHRSYSLKQCGLEVDWRLEQRQIRRGVLAGAASRAGGAPGQRSVMAKAAQAAKKAFDLVFLGNSGRCVRA